ncbi:MAG: chemotaxis protein CheW [Gammaproteobacteria bacterium]
MIFNLDDARFGLDAAAVLETVRLPELTPIEEAPPWIVGMFNLRGLIIPVVDLHLRFGHAPKSYCLSDQIIVLKVDQKPIGLIVNEVLEVIELPAESVRDAPEFDRQNHSLKHLTKGMACVGDDLVTLLDITRLEELSASLEPQEITEPTKSGRISYSDTTPEALSLLHRRAMALRKSIVEEEVDRLGLAVVQISDEYFGIELTAVQEFCNITQITPIPCCPPHILGAISLRGTLLTLMDPRSVLNLTPQSGINKAVIAQYGNHLIAVSIDEVHDVVYLRAEDLQAAPTSLGDRLGIEIKGTAPYAGKTMTVLDLPALLQREEWIVNEIV